jgi:hypothetical protein
MRGVRFDPNEMLRDLPDPMVLLVVVGAAVSPQSIRTSGESTFA